jgi:molecular chaperone DnaK
LLKKVPTTTEESVAYALVDSDLEDITQVPQAARVARSASAEPGSSPYAQENIITKAGDADLNDDEPTKVGRVATMVMPTAPWMPPPPPPVAGRTAPIPLAAPFPPPSSPPPSSRPSSPPSSPAPPFSRTLEGFGQLPQPLAQPMSAPPPAAVQTERAPLLIDVTPLTLAVETVSGYCDPIIARNTQVPCEEQREFVTATDGQTVVRVRVSQGESKRFGENTLLGEVELSGLPAAPRGSVQISVCFGLDANGMLNVSATEVQTGRATAAQLRLIGLPDAHGVTAMVTRHNQRQTA